MNSNYVAQDKEQVYELINMAQMGDLDAREQLIINNSGLVKKIASKFANRDYDVEDLIQLGYIGLIKAIDKFDTGFGVMFSTYAVPVIMGEIKRYLRDDGRIKVSRSVKADIKTIREAENKILLETGEGARISQLAQETGLSEEEIGQAISTAENTALASLDEIIEEKGDGGFGRKSEEERLDDIIQMKSAVEKLEPRDRNIIALRYFCDYTQNQIAERLGISQVQVSRIEKKVLERLRENLT